MRYSLYFLVLSCISIACQKSSTNQILVENDATLKAAIEQANAGDEIIMANGEWNDIKIRFTGEGTENNPITLRAESPGEVVIKGQSDLKLAGEYLIVKDLLFTEGFSPTDAAIEFKIDDDYANHCKVINCVILDFNKPARNISDIWVQFHGRHNSLDHCYISGKSNKGPTVRVDLRGNESIKNYHQITNNHFGPRPQKGGPSAETIQIGNSFTSMAPSYTMVADNFFERCNGEVEVISSKTNFNEFRNNVFYKSEGSLVTRHGNYCLLDGNYFIGDEQSEQIGGIRLIGTGHWVTNNYFYNLKGQNFRSPLAVMNGIPKSPLNRYIQVTDVVVAYNSWINCKSPLQFGVGSNVSQKDVLPASEIRSERPIRTTVANNLIYNTTGDPDVVLAHDKLNGIKFKSNVINNQSVDFENKDGFKISDFTVQALNDFIVQPKNSFDDLELYNGFEFNTITHDLFKQSRSNNNSVGAISQPVATDPNILDASRYGADWYDPSSKTSEGKRMKINADANALLKAINDAAHGDTLVLASGDYNFIQSIAIDKKLSLQSENPEKPARLVFTNDEGPAFEMNPKGKLYLDHIQMQGNGSQAAFASLKENMSSLYNLSLTNCSIDNFDYILKGYKHSFSEYLIFKNSSFINCSNGIELSEETDDKGDYNAENIIIDGCQFEKIAQNVIDYYRGGYDESTVGGTLKVLNSEFKNCGVKEKNRILINTYGIINVDISNNRFTNNRVKHIALLWGAKNNTHSNNTISNSGTIRTEENLKLNLLY